jgi:ubiquitin carboxyl-terminal hydrolase L3
MAADADVDLHFICFIEKDGSLWEMDGRKKCPINHGPCDELLESTATVVKQFMQREPGKNIQLNNR